MGPGSSWWAMPACTRARSHRARLISAERAWRGRFFFSSRRRHTRWNYDWSSDVCSSDLGYSAAKGDALVRGELCLEAIRLARVVRSLLPEPVSELEGLLALMLLHDARRATRVDVRGRSEERRVGKECRCRWWPYQ